MICSLPRKAVTTNKMAFVGPDKLLHTKFIAYERHNTTCCMPVDSFCRQFPGIFSFSTYFLIFLSYLHISKRLEQCPLCGNYRSQHKIALPSGRGPRTFRRCEFTVFMIFANSKKAKRTFHIANSSGRKELAIC